MTVLSFCARDFGMVDIASLGYSFCLSVSGFFTFSSSVVQIVVVPQKRVPSNPSCGV